MINMNHINYILIMHKRLVHNVAYDSYISNNSNTESFLVLREYYSKVVLKSGPGMI